MKEWDFKEKLNLNYTMVYQMQKTKTNTNTNKQKTCCRNKAHVLVSAVTFKSILKTEFSFN